MKHIHEDMTRKIAKSSSKTAWRCSLLLLFVMVLVSYYQNTKSVLVKLLLSMDSRENRDMDMPAVTTTTITPSSTFSLSKRRRLISRGKQPVARNGAYFFNTNTMHPFTRSDRQEHLIYYDLNMSFAPRVVVLAEAQNDTASASTTPSTTSRSVAPMSTIMANVDIIDAKSYQYPFEQPYYQQCDFIDSWQTTFYPTCNILHELNMIDNELSLLTTRGSWRTVWNYHDHHHHDHENEVVVKLLHLNRSYDEESFHYHQVDSMSMERLTSSRYVIDEYAFCGQSVVTQKARGAARDLVKRNDFLPMHRLRMARDLARGLNDIHSIDYHHSSSSSSSSSSKNMATLCHNDINMANMVHDADKNILFNDFNIAVLLKRNNTSACGYPQRFVGDLWRSPEELRNTTYVDEKADVYSLGNVLFQVMTKHQPWTWLEPGGKIPLEEVVKRKIQGELPHFPTEFSESQDVAIRVLYEGILACFRHEPTKRPTAYQLAKGFSEVLDWIRKKKKIKRDVNILKRLFEVESMRRVI